MVEPDLPDLGCLMFEKRGRLQFGIWLLISASLWFIVLGFFDVLDSHHFRENGFQYWDNGRVLRQIPR